MKVLAVIPARGGSKGIPNKNIRLLGNRPLIYYAINNAKQSGRITDIVVSTDSEEIAIVARQMGVQVKMRDASLAGDAVTLDSVIYDVAKDIACDYVVTMQPTSPTLKVATLDGAIAYCVEKDLDTLISAIDHPHLAWVADEQGQKKPAYRERLNRQYLPPYYLETGAFVVSKASAVTKTSRIGRRVDVYEISEEEAVDIDSFSDLRTAELLLENKRIAIYVNGNNKRGTGHVYRALELADEFYVKPDIYYDINQTDKAVFGETTHNLIGINGIGELFEVLKREQYDLIINDVLSTTIDYILGIRACVPKIRIVSFEDDGEGAREADLVFNALFEQEPQKNMYSGEKYYIAPKVWMFYPPVEIRPEVKHVFISFGGADPQNYTERYLRIIEKEKYRDFKFTVVLGRAKQHVEELQKQCEAYPNIDVFHNVKNMPELVSECDVAVTSRGRTGYELAMLGIPTIAMSQNEREEMHTFVSDKNGFTYIGLKPDDETMEKTLDQYFAMSEEERKKRHEMLLSHELRDGRKRIINMINSL